jgi:hypothetical protein
MTDADGRVRKALATFLLYKVENMDSWAVEFEQELMDRDMDENPNIVAASNAIISELQNVLLTKIEVLVDGEEVPSQGILGEDASID